MKRLYNINDIQIKKEVIKAITAIFQANSNYEDIILNIFEIEEIINDNFADITKELLKLACTKLQTIRNCERIMIVLNKLLINPDELKESLKMIYDLITINPKATEYIAIILVEKLLKLLYDSSLELSASGDIQNLSLLIIGCYIINIENSYLKLLPLKIFDYLLPLLYRNIPTIKDCLWVISNLITESDSVIEILIINQGFLQILNLLNTNCEKIIKEIIFILYNASRIANKQQCKYFIEIGTALCLSKLLSIKDQDLQNIVFETIINLIRKYPDLEIEELVDIINNIETLEKINQTWNSKINYLNHLAESKL